MDPQKLEIKKLDASTADGSVLQFINEYFSKNPMNDLFQIEGDMLVAINKYLADGKTSLLAYYDDELVGCRTGNIYTYAQYLKEFETVFSKFTAFLDPSAPNVENNQRVMACMEKVSEFDHTKYGITDESVLYEAGALCTMPKMRQLKVGSQLVEKSLKMAKDAGAEYYKVIVVSTFAKKIFDKFGFETVNTIKYAEMFKDDKDILDRIDPIHPEAYLVLKKLWFELFNFQAARLVIKVRNEFTEG